MPNLRGSCNSVVQSEGPSSERAPARENRRAARALHSTFGMIAMQLRAPAAIESHPLHAVELERPVPGERELLLRVTACGVCRTDLQLVEGDLRSRGASQSSRATES